MKTRRRNINILFVLGIGSKWKCCSSVSVCASDSRRDCRAQHNSITEQTQAYEEIIRAELLIASFIQPITLNTADKQHGGRFHCSASFTLRKSSC